MSLFFINKIPSQVQLELAKKCRVIRKRKKISQSELANKSGVSLGSIKRFENSGQISLGSLLKLAHYFDRLDDFDNVFRIEDNMDDIEKLFTK